MKAKNYLLAGILSIVAGGILSLVMSRLGSDVAKVLTVVIGFAAISVSGILVASSRAVARRHPSKDLAVLVGPAMSAPRHVVHKQLVRYSANRYGSLIAKELTRDRIRCDINLQMETEYTPLIAELIRATEAVLVEGRKESENSNVVSIPRSYAKA